MSDYIQRVAETASATVDQFNADASGALDFSEASLAAVESILARLAAQEDPIDIRTREELIEGFGAYIFEVARREFGGRFAWHQDSGQPVLIVGEPECHVAIITWDVVRGRLAGDPSSNAPFFYTGFAERARRASRGDNVLFV